jgi:hypothetical protein
MNGAPGGFILETNWVKGWMIPGVLSLFSLGLAVSD